MKGAADIAASVSSKPIINAGESSKIDFATGIRLYSPIKKSFTKLVKNCLIAKAEHRHLHPELTHNVFS